MKKLIVPVVVLSTIVARSGPVALEISRTNQTTHLVWESNNYARVFFTPKIDVEFDTWDSSQCTFDCDTNRPTWYVVAETNAAECDIESTNDTGFYLISSENAHDN